MVKFEISIARRHLYAAVAFIAAVALIVPAAGWAADKFNDVPDSNIFHDDIAWLADAGVTKGCNPPANDEFCPSDTVRRETMAAFMRRLAVNKVVDAATAVTAESSDDSALLDGKAASYFMPAIPQPGDKLTGAWGAGAPSGSFGVAAVSFPTELPYGVASDHVEFIGEGGPFTANCPGFGEAAFGYLCIYEAFNNTMSAPQLLHDVDGFIGGDASTTGLLMFFTSSSAAGNSRGQWVLTLGASGPAAVAPDSSLTPDSNIASTP